MRVRLSLLLFCVATLVVCYGATDSDEMLGEEDKSTSPAASPAAKAPAKAPMSGTNATKAPPPKKPECKPLSSKEEKYLGKFAKMLPLCDEAIAFSGRKELAEPFTLMQKDSIDYRTKIQSYTRKFDHLESKYLTIKEEQEDIEYQFGKLKAATVLAKRDLREEELTYEALIVATQMESGKLSTRAKAFRRMKRKEESFLVRERLAIEAKEAKATGKPNVEGLILDSAMKKVINPAEELGEPSHDMASVKAHTSQMMGTLGKLAATFEPDGLGDGEEEEAAPALTGLAALSPEEMKNIPSAGDRLAKAKSVCGAANKAAKGSKGKAEAAIARDAELKRLQARRDGEAKTANALCAKHTKSLERNPDDITVSALKTKECDKGLAYTLQYNKLGQALVRQKATMKATASLSDKDAKDAIVICEKAAEIIKIAQIEVNKQRAMNKASNAEAQVGAMQEAKAEGTLAVAKAQKKLANLTKQPNSSSAYALELNAVQRELAAAQKANTAARAALKDAKVASRAALGALTQEQRLELAEKALLALANDPSRMIRRIKLVKRATKAAQGEVDRLNDVANAAMTKVATYQAEISTLSRAIERREAAKGVYATQNTLLAEKKAVVQALQIGGKSQVSLLQIAQRAAADIEARIAAARDTIARGNRAESRIEGIRAHMAEAKAEQIKVKSAAELAAGEVGRLEAQGSGMAKKQLEATAFAEQMQAEASPTTGAMNAAQAKKAAEQATAAAAVAAAKRKALEAKRASAVARAEKESAADDAARLEEEEASTEAKQMAARKEKEKDSQDNPLTMNMIILQEKFKSLIKAYTALSMTYFMSIDRDIDIKKKLAAAKAKFESWTNKYWALSSVSDQIAIKLKSEMRKTAALKPAKKSAGFIQKQGGA